MDQQRKARNFLYRIYGYAAIRELTESSHSPRRMEEALENTILSTGKGNSFPYPSKVQRTEKAEKAASGYNLDDNTLPYHIGTMNYLSGFSQKEIQEFLEPELDKLYPQRDIEGRQLTQTRWEQRTKAEGINIYVQGSTANDTRILIVDVDISRGAYVQLNDEIQAYYDLLRWIKTVQKKTTKDLIFP